MARHRNKNRRNRRRTPERHPSLSPLARLLLFNLFLVKQPLDQRELLKKLQKSGYTNTECKEEIARLVRRGLVEGKGKSKLALNRTAPFYTGTLEMKPAGFGFATDVDSLGKRKTTFEDPFIPRSELFSARHADRILMLVNLKSRRKNPEAEVLGSLEHSSSDLTGYFHVQGNRYVVYPEDPRFPFTIVLGQLQKSTDKPEIGDVVIVRLDEKKSTPSSVHGEIVEILGNPDLPEVQIRMVAEKYDLPGEFSPEALLEAKRVETAPDIVDREDLRDLLHYTIDGEDAKDFDDAIAVLKLRHGYRLYVSIADVAAYVKPGSKLDEEAYERGTSTYFPGFVVPMLPENLSNNLCSLMADEDRLTMTAVLDFDRQGLLLKKRFARSIIKSKMRFTYAIVKRIIVDKDVETRRRFETFLTPLKWATELGEALQRQRMVRGSIALTIPEAEIRLDATGGIVAIEGKQRSFANQLIEEFMLAANEAVAGTFDELGVDLLYRIHELPDPDKVKNFATIANAFGLNPGNAEPTPNWYNSMVNQVQETDRELIVNSLLLRTLQQARYSIDNTGHFGIGAPNYTHFTSPIRRYPDLIVHRLLANLISSTGESAEDLSPAPYRSLKDAGLHLSERERNSISAEREMAERLKCRFMEQRIGERFKAIISSLSDTMFFVDLLGQFVSGTVFLSSLTDDYYLHDWKRHRLIGDITGKILQVGEIIDVELTEVDMSTRKIIFTVAG
ncbi:MAG: ribonuclease R [Desulfocapsaceae bacterium]